MATASVWEEKRTILGKLIWRFFWKCLRGSPSLADHYAAVQYGILPLAVLDFLRVRDPMIGYEIVKGLTAQYPDKPNGFNYGELYPVLGILTTCDLLRAEKRPAPPGRGPYRIYYRLTTRGYSIFPDQQQ
jgi:PadR family transcriptional regulator